MFSLKDRKQIFEKWFSGMENVILDFHEYGVFDKSSRPYSEKSENLKSRRYFHTLNDLIDRYGTNNDYFTIVGEDSWDNLESWYRWNNILDLSKFIVVERGDKTDNDCCNENAIKDYRLVKPKIKLDSKFLNMSASDIRKRLEKGVVDSMSTGTIATPLLVYLEEVDDYLKTGKTYEDRKKEYNDSLGLGIEALSKIDRDFAKLQEKLDKIRHILADPYKDEVCKYSLIEDIVKGYL